jgi:hypothetical protein
MSTSVRLVNLMGMTIQPPTQKESLHQKNDVPLFFKHLSTLKAGDKIDIYLNAMRLLFPEVYARPIPSYEQVQQDIFDQTGVSIKFLEKPDKFPVEQRKECLASLATILFHQRFDRPKNLEMSTNQDQEKQIASSSSETIGKLPVIIKKQTASSSKENGLGKRKREKEKPTESLTKLPKTQAESSPSDTTLKQQRDFLYQPARIENTIKHGLVFLEELEALENKNKK